MRGGGAVGAGGKGRELNELVSLILVGDLEEMQVEGLLEVVQAALDGCADDDPRYDGLVEIEYALLAGRLPVEQLLFGRSGSCRRGLRVERADRQVRGPGGSSMGPPGRRPRC